jgi:hypothetical protein
LEQIGHSNNCQTRYIFYHIGFSLANTRKLCTSNFITTVPENYQTEREERLGNFGIWPRTLAPEIGRHAAGRADVLYVDCVAGNINPIAIRLVFKLNISCTLTGCHRGVQSHHVSNFVSEKSPVRNS